MRLTIHTLPRSARLALGIVIALALTLLETRLAGGAAIGAITLVEAAKLSRDDLQRGVIETFIQESVVLDTIPLLEINGNAYAYNEEAALPGVEFRAVNAGYTESTGTVNQKTEKLVILGGDADVDKFIEETRSNLNDQRATQTRLKIKALAFKFQDTFINGDVTVDANGFDGLKKRLVGGQVLDAATNGLSILGDASSGAINTFFDQLDALINAVQGGADVLYMNRMVLGKIRSAARRLGAWTQSRDEFGRTIDYYNGVALRDIGTKADGSLIIPQTETQGTSSLASSIYAVRFGQDEADQAVTGLTNGGVRAYDLGELETKPAYRTRVEFYTGVAVFGKGAARLRGVLTA